MSANEIFSFCIFPLLGLIFSNVFSKRTSVVLIIITLILLIPILTPYEYVIPHFYIFLCVVLVSMLYSLPLRTSEKPEAKVWGSVALSLVLFLLLGFNAALKGFAGGERVTDSWHIGKYKIKYIEEYGFSGKHVFRYKIDAIAKLPIFTRELETMIDDDSTNSCKVNFHESRLIFDKCYETIQTSGL